MKRAAAEIIEEYGPLPGVEQVAGVTYDGENLWIAAGTRLEALDPNSGRQRRSIDVAAYAGSAYDGRYLYQIGDNRIRKIDPGSGQVLATIDTPGEGCSGLAWAEGSLCVGQ
jgi:glutamine cyclotransferase